MKKFNVNELIWFLTLLLMEITLVYLFKSKEIYNYLEVGILNIKIVQYVILIFIGFQFPKIFTFNSRCDESLEAFPIILSFLIIILFVSRNILF